MVESNLGEQLEQVSIARKLVQAGFENLSDTARNIQEEMMSVGSVLEENQTLDTLYDGNDYVLLMTLDMEAKLQTWVYIERADIQQGTTLVGLGNGSGPDSMRLSDCCIATAKNHQPVIYQIAGEFEDDGHNLRLKETTITEREFASKTRDHMKPKEGQRTKVFASVIKRLDDYQQNAAGSSSLYGSSPSEEDFSDDDSSSDF